MAHTIHGTGIFPKDPFVCPKQGIGPPTFLFFLDGIGTLNPILGRGLDSYGLYIF